MRVLKSLGYIYDSSEKDFDLPVSHPLRPGRR
jgi:hypothetical protein